MGGPTAERGTTFGGGLPGRRGRLRRNVRALCRNGGGYGGAAGIGVGQAARQGGATMAEIMAKTLAKTKRS